MITESELLTTAAHLYDECLDPTFRRGITMLVADLLHPGVAADTAQQLVIQEINNINHPRLFD